MKILALACLMLLGCRTAVAIGKCSSVAPHLMATRSAHYEISGIAANIFPLYAGERQLDANITWALNALTERNRTHYDVYGKPLAYSRCVSPSSGETSIFHNPDPAQPSYPGNPCADEIDWPCGELYQVIYAQDMD